MGRIQSTVTSGLSSIVFSAGGVLSAVISSVARALVFAWRTSVVFFKQAESIVMMTTRREPFCSGKRIIVSLRKAAQSGALLGVLLASSNWACTGVLDGGSGGVGVGPGRNPGPVGGTAGGVGVATGPLDPGRVPLRRLNRAEYCNTVHDLLGTAQRPCDQFPEDNAIFGFD